MSRDVNAAYLETRVRTATPQRLQVMLIDGALRFAHQSLQHWDGGLPGKAAYDAIVRCRDIVAEIYGSIKQDQAPVAEQVAAIYLFLFRRLSEAPLHQDPQRVRDVIRVLEQERITWESVCEKMPEPPFGAGVHFGTSEEITVDDIGRLSATAMPAGSLASAFVPPSPNAANGFSLEA